MGTQRMGESHILRRELDSEIKGQRKKSEQKGHKRTRLRKEA